MPLHDMMDTEWIRFKDAAGHLGALYNPKRNIIRFVRGGTVEYNLAMFAIHDQTEIDEQRKTDQAQVEHRQ